MENVRLVLTGLAVVLLFFVRDTKVRWLEHVFLVISGAAVVAVAVGMIQAYAQSDPIKWGGLVSVFILAVGIGLIRKKRKAAGDGDSSQPRAASE